MEVAVVFVRYFSDISTFTANNQEAQYRKSVANLKNIPFSKGGGHQNNEHLLASFSLNEMQNILSQCKDAISVVDEITISMLNHMSVEYLAILLSACNMHWESWQYLDTWRREIKLPVANPNKNPAEMGITAQFLLSTALCKL